MAVGVRKKSTIQKYEQRMAKEDVPSARKSTEQSFTWTNIPTNLKLREAAFTIQILFDIPRYNSNYRAFQTCVAEVD